MSISNQNQLEGLLFKATNPTNKIEDVNTIKQFCDVVSANSEGPAIACRLLAHKIQSPQEREAIQALAVLEASVKACGPAFHAEVGKFKFLNEMIKLVSPKFLASRTPEHIKKKIIEILYVWTKELKEETKIAEAYDMLKKEGLVKEDPDYVRSAVFASALPPRQPEPLSDDQSKLLKRLLQSKNPDDLQQANKIIKGMVKEDERKMDEMTKRSTELIMVNNNSKLLNEMLDHYNKSHSGPEELELFKELFNSCEKMQTKLFRLASETEEGDECIGDILQASDDLSQVIDRYKMVIVQGKPDITKRVTKQPSDTLLDLEQLGDRDPEPSKPEVREDDDILSLFSSTEESIARSPPGTSKEPVSVEETPVSSSPSITSQPQSVDDLLNGSLLDPVPSLLIDSLPSTLISKPKTVFEQKMEEQRSSRQKGLEELDFLGETAIKSHLTSRSPQFAKREKIPMNKMQNVKREIDLTQSLQENLKFGMAKSEEKKTKAEAGNLESEPSGKVAKVKSGSEHVDTPTPPSSSETATKDYKLSNLNVPISSIKPGATKPITLQDEDEGISIVLNFGQDKPRGDVTAMVLTIMNKSGSTLSDLEFKAVVPKGCRVKLQPASNTTLPPHNPFVPPSAITQVMLISNPESKLVSLKYVLSYLQDEEPQTEMGEVKQLPC